ncbi:MAG: inositol-3-phosphate synthase [Myxococcota bacterium]
MKNKVKIKPAKGKLGVLIPGIGAVSTTFIAGVLAVRKNLGIPYGSLTQMGRIRLGKRTEDRHPLLKDFLPLTDLNDIVFGGWDLHGENAYNVACKSRVLASDLLDKIRPSLEQINPMKAVFDKNFVKNLDGPHVKSGKNKLELARQLMDDIERFKKKNNLERVVTVWCASTEVFTQLKNVHQNLKAFEKGLKKNNPHISPSMIYAYASLKKNSPFLNGAPNLTVDIPALTELADTNKVPIGGKDFKTGQTLIKTILAPGLKSRLLGVKGWFSTNILGNLDGKVLDDPGSFKTKEESKLSVLDSIFSPELYPELYGDIDHKVRINYYLPRGDNKEGWDNIDITGWMGYPMQIKVNFLCRDSILAAPVVLDLILLADIAHRAKMYGIQEWLSFYWKSPQTKVGLPPVHDLFKQLSKLENTLRFLMGETLINNLGLDYYYGEDLDIDNSEEE